MAEGASSSGRSSKDVPGVPESIQKEIPQMREMMGSFLSKAEELQDKVKEVVTSEPENGAQVQEGVSYLAVKQQMLLSYALDVCLYLGMKLEGKSVNDHPLAWQLLELQTVMEKLRPLDHKLKYETDKLLRLAHTGEGAPENDPLSYRPNPGALVGPGEEEEEEQEEQSPAASSSKPASLSKGPGGAGAGVYRPPRMTAVPYDDEKNTEKKEKIATRKKERLRRSEILDTLREDFSERPERVVDDIGTNMFKEDAKRKMQEEDEERKNFEEDHMIRMQLSRKQKKERRRITQDASMMSNIADVGNVGELMRWTDDAPEESGPKKGKGSARNVGGALGAAVGAVGQTMRKKKTRRK